MYQHHKQIVLRVRSGGQHSRITRDSGNPLFPMPPVHIFTLLHTSTLPRLAEHLYVLILTQCQKRFGQAGSYDTDIAWFKTYPFGLDAKIQEGGTDRVISAEWIERTIGRVA
jgi:hypothetical protein